MSRLAFAVVVFSAVGFLASVQALVSPDPSTQVHGAVAFLSSGGLLSVGLAYW